MSEPADAPCRHCCRPTALGSTLFPPNSRYHGVADRDSSRGPTAATVVYLRRRFVPPPERFALLHEHAVVAGRSARQPWRPATSAIPSSSGGSATPTARCGPDELTGNVGAAMRITLPEGVPGGAMPVLEGHHLTLMIGPAVPVPAPRVVLDALDQSVRCHDERRRTERLPADVPPRASARRCNTLFLLAGGQHRLTPSLRVVIVVTVNGTPRRADRRRDHQQQVQPGSRRGARDARRSPART